MNYRIIILATLLVFLLGVSSLIPHSARADDAGISSLTIEADRAEYLGPCPREIHLIATIRAVAPLGIVSYQFVHSDGSPTAIAQLNINRSGQFIVEETQRKTASWSDTVYLRVYVPVPGRAPVLRDSDRIRIKGECQYVQPVTRSESISLGPGSGRFRVTLNGFTCNRQTAELNNFVLRDGSDDEVFLFTKSFFVEKRAGSHSPNVSPPFISWTEVIGDTSGVHTVNRVQGGSGRFLGGNGGFRPGDSFPGDPRKHSTNPQLLTLPQLIWEGELTRRQNAIVIMPMIWEWDGVSGLLEAWRRVGLEQFHGVVDLISDPNLTNSERAKVGLMNEVGDQVQIFRGYGNGLLGLGPQDRPIGLRALNDYYRFQPELLILTYDEALRMIVKSRQNNGEAFPVVYHDARELGGIYTLYIQVERLP